MDAVRCPLYPQKQTLLSATEMSAKCQKDIGSELSPGCRQICKLPDAVA
jgi:hypothetical protein